MHICEKRSFFRRNSINRVSPEAKFSTTLSSFSFDLFLSLPFDLCFLFFLYVFVLPSIKVSGDKPVFVESVKAGGAAHKAGLMERDMIVKVSRSQKIFHVNFSHTHNNFYAANMAIVVYRYNILHANHHTEKRHNCMCGLLTVECTACDMAKCPRA